MKPHLLKNNELLILDKDDTLIDHRTQFFPGVSEFLRGQSRLRDLVVATRAGIAGKAHLKKIEPYLQGYYGQEVLDARKRFYHRGDGTFGEIAADFEQNPESKLQQARLIKKIRLLMKHAERNQEAIDELDHQEAGAARFWRRYSHEPLEDFQLYQNPHFPDGVHMDKDIHLLRLHLQSGNKNHFKSVMIGNESDAIAVASDPQTPLVVVAPDGEWAGRSNMRLLIDYLFNPKYTPEQVYDTLFSVGQPIQSRDKDAVAVETFILDRAFRLRKKHFPKAEFPARLIDEHR